jgi:hypothetical protein
MSAISDLRRTNCNQCRPRDVFGCCHRDGRQFDYHSPRRSKWPPCALLSQNDWYVCIAVIVAKDRLSGLQCLDYLPGRKCEVCERCDSTGVNLLLESPVPTWHLIHFEGPEAAAIRFGLPLLALSLPKMFR